MTYHECVDYLYGLASRGIKLGPANTQRLLKYFGNPQLKISTIHIAGTNGKGSTSACIESILRAAGQRTGLYTSPHLFDFRERIQIDRALITEQDFVDLTLTVKNAAETLHTPLTFFEFGTLMAFLYFFEKGAQWSVIEAGMGGRLDATNLCQPEACAITNVTRDHVEYLGHDLRQIAFEKAGIIKNRRTVFTGNMTEEVFAVIQQQARRKHAGIKRLNKDFITSNVSLTNRSQLFDFTLEKITIKQLELPLIGRHQIDNAAVAVATCLDMKTAGITESVIRKGLKNTRWEGRLEIIGTHPTIVLDCAHNPDGISKLTAALREYFRFNRCHVILGVMKDKACNEMIDIIIDIADHLILVKPATDRAWDPEPLRERGMKSNKPIEIIDEIQYAVSSILGIVHPNDLICVTGSIFTVAEAKQAFVKQGVIKNTSDYSGDIHRQR